MKQMEFMKESGKSTFTHKEEAFINAFLSGATQSEAVRQAGYKTKNVSALATQILNRPHVKAEIQMRMKEAHKKGVMDSEEIMLLWSNIARGNVKDDLGFEPPFADRLKALSEIAKRTIDVEQRGKNGGEIKVTLSFDGFEKEGDADGDTDSAGD